MQESVNSVIPVIIFFAPTACGKTARARELFGSSSLSLFKQRGEVVSADSQAVYRGMDIGTAKPTAEECSDIPHHLINLVKPDEQFGLGEWFHAADESCKKIWFDDKKFPIIVGGTGFYVRNFILGQPETPQSDIQIRKELSDRMKAQGREKLYAELQSVDPQSASRINQNDEYRILRALEVYHSCGRPLSSFVLPKTPRKEYDFCTIILTREKESLYHRIDERVEQMFSLGLEKEVARLVSEGYNGSSPGMKAIGYREFFMEPKELLVEHGNNWISVDDKKAVVNDIPGIVLGTRAITHEERIAIMKEQIKLDSRHYAKKQYTFMSDIPGAISIDADDKQRVIDEVARFCAKYSA